MAEFKNEASFFRAKFGNDINFSGSRFQKKVNFFETRFQKQASFIGTKDHKCFDEECVFRSINLDKEAVIVFERVNLSKAKFMDTNVEQIIFRDVEWHKPTKIWVRRKQALWDEFRPLKKDEKYDFEKIAENYRQLVLNYERKRDYETAENFHIGEMEMRRKKKGSNINKPLRRKLRQSVNEYGLYKLLSNYGTSYVKALIMLLSLLFLFSAFFLYAGFEPTGLRATSGSQVIDYDVFPDLEHTLRASLGEWLTDYFQAFSLTLSIISFQRERFYQPEEEFCSRLWLYVSVIVLTGQAALVLLSIRRRFKR